MGRMRSWKQALSAAWGGLLASSCAVTPHPSAQTPVAVDTPAQRLEGTRHLQYRVGVRIDAPVSTVWALLVDAKSYPQWNRSVVSLEGQIAPGETLRLVSSASPTRTFKLKVQVLEPEQRMVWGSGGRAFGGQRTFVLTPRGPNQTDFMMTEDLGGTMMKMIQKKLPDLRKSFDTFAQDLRSAAEAGRSGGA